MKGLHDNPALYPILPGREIDREFLNNAAPEGNEYREAWEYLLSHTLTEAEGSAFWHAVGIQAAATRRVVAREFTPTETVAEPSECPTCGTSVRWIIGKCPNGWHQATLPSTRAVIPEDGMFKATAPVSDDAGLREKLAWAIHRACGCGPTITPTGPGPICEPDGEDWTGAGNVLAVLAAHPAPTADETIGLLEDFDGAPYPDEVQQAHRLAMTARSAPPVTVTDAIVELRDAFRAALDDDRTLTWLRDEDGDNYIEAGDVVALLDRLLAGYPSPQTITEVMVERAMKAMIRFEFEEMGVTDVSDEAIQKGLDEGQADGDNWRGLARAALSAALTEDGAE